MKYEIPEELNFKYINKKTEDLRLEQDASREIYMDIMSALIQRICGGEEIPKDINMTDFNNINPDSSVSVGLAFYTGPELGKHARKLYAALASLFPDHHKHHGNRLKTYRYNGLSEDIIEKATAGRASDDMEVVARLLQATVTAINSINDNHDYQVHFPINDLIPRMDKVLEVLNMTDSEFNLWLRLQ